MEIDIETMTRADAVQLYQRLAETERQCQACGHMVCIAELSQCDSCHCYMCDKCAQSPGDAKLCLPCSM